MSETEPESPETLEEALQLPSGPALLRTRHIAFHLAVVVFALCLFAAADSWFTLSGLGLAAALSILTGLAAGFVFTSEVHEWFHYLGAKFSGGNYSTPETMGLFVYDWDFEKSNVKQFFAMSVAGNIGGLLALVWLASSIETDTVARSALIAGSVASVAFAAAIEWPVLWRTRESRAPFAELSKVDAGVLQRASMTSLGAGLLVWYLL